MAVCISLTAYSRVHHMHLVHHLVIFMQIYIHNLTSLMLSVSEGSK